MHAHKQGEHLDNAKIKKAVVNAIGVYYKIENNSANNEKNVV